MIAELIAEIPHRVKLSPEDLAPSPTRAGEVISEQQVRNMTSHKRGERLTRARNGTKPSNDALGHGGIDRLKAGGPIHHHKAS